MTQVSVSTARNLSSSSTNQPLYTIWTHQSSFSNEDVILSKDLFEEFIKIGDFIRITCVDNAIVVDSNQQQSIMLQNSGLILKVTSMQNGRVEVSINKQVADALNIKPYSRVMIHQVNPRDFEVDFVELTFKRQFLQRGNMWRFKKSMFGRPGTFILLYYIYLLLYVCMRLHYVNTCSNYF